jgi:hypothetical protein
MLEDANKAYFKSQGWPMMLSGEPKSIVQLDKGELTALALKYAIVLQTEFAQIKVPPKPTLTKIGTAGVSLMQSHSPAALAGVYFGVRMKTARAKRGHGPRGFKLTKPMIEVMTLVERYGSGAWCPGGRTGGAVGRMWGRLVKAGYSTEAPYCITAAGRAALKSVPIKHKRITPAAIQRMSHLGNHNRSRR